MNQKILKSLFSNTINIDIGYFKQIPSTNEYLEKKEFDNKIYLAVAETQTKGKGRQGSKWVSSSNENIYASLGLKLNKSITHYMPFLSLSIALSIAYIIQKFTVDSEKENIKIKLPNDIYYKNQKLAGILIETKKISQNSFDIIVGFGINVNVQNLKENINREYSSLKKINNKDINIESLLFETVEKILINIKKFNNLNLSELINEFKKFDYTLNKKISFLFDNTKIIGVSKGLDMQGKLNLYIDDELKLIDITNINKLTLVR